MIMTVPESNHILVQKICQGPWYDVMVEVWVMYGLCLGYVWVMYGFIFFCPENSKNRWNRSSKLHAFLYAFLALPQMFFSKIQNFLKLALPYLTKRCLKYYLGRLTKVSEFSSQYFHFFQYCEVLNSNK